MVKFYIQILTLHIWMVNVYIQICFSHLNGECVYPNVHWTFEWWNSISKFNMEGDECQKPLDGEFDVHWMVIFYIQIFTFLLWAWHRTFRLLTSTMCHPSLHKVSAVLGQTLRDYDLRAACFGFHTYVLGTESACKNTIPKPDLGQFHMKVCEQ